MATFVLYFLLNWRQNQTSVPPDDITYSNRRIKLTLHLRVVIWQMNERTNEQTNEEISTRHVGVDQKASPARVMASCRHENVGWTTPWRAIDSKTIHHRRRDLERGTTTTAWNNDEEDDWWRQQRKITTKRTIDDDNKVKQRRRVRLMTTTIWNNDEEDDWWRFGG